MRNTWSKAHLLSLMLFAAIVCGPRSQAANSPIPHGTVELISERQWITAGRTVNFGLHFQLDKGWHIYWINPGDSGEPPRVKWQLPSGLTAKAIEWPVPQRLGTSSIVDFGYENAVTLIVPMYADADLPDQKPARLAAQLSVLVCREMCLTGKAEVSLTVPIKPQTPTADARTAELFAAARKALPRPAPMNWKFALSDVNSSFSLTVSLGRQITHALFYPLVESQVDNAAAQKLLPTPNGFRLTLRKSDQLLKPIERLKGVLVLSADQAYLIDVPVDKSSAVTDSSNIGTHPVTVSRKGVSE